MTASEKRQLTIQFNDLIEYLWDHPDASTIAEEIDEIEATLADAKGR